MKSKIHEFNFTQKHKSMSTKTIILSLAALLFTTVAMAQQGSKEVNKKATVVSKPYLTTTATAQTKKVVRSAEYNKRAEERANRGRKESWGNPKTPLATK